MLSEDKTCFCVHSESNLEKMPEKYFELNAEKVDFSFPTLPEQTPKPKYDSPDERSTSRIFFYESMDKQIYSERISEPI